ncbi:hypothetical protein PoB_007592500 [Plakobranchus ocellatus]|uniref:Uncharacterized protein n=1 Tax=Plakobranchus ocellatus TaxID=259542 RepID=A0AAV4DYZ8_9GAST|nr:hypothetical protein PoB_007592500 [Plakobranchus ocellatus]
MILDDVENGGGDNDDDIEGDLGGHNDDNGDALFSHNTRFVTVNNRHCYGLYSGDWAAAAADGESANGPSFDKLADVSSSLRRIVRDTKEPCKG